MHPCIAALHRAKTRRWSGLKPRSRTFPGPDASTYHPLAFPEESAMSNVKSMDAIMALCKRRGFVFQASDIYGGINGFWGRRIQRSDGGL